MGLFISELELYKPPEELDFMIFNFRIDSLMFENHYMGAFTRIERSFWLQNSWI